MRRRTQRLILLVILTSLGTEGVALPTDPFAADAVVAQCIEAMGGQEKLDALHSLRVTMHWPDHGTLRTDIERPNRSSLGMNGEVVFDGDRAAMLKRGPDGTRVCDMAVPEGDLVDFDVDIAWYVPAFLDYPAVYAGTATLGNGEMDVLEVTLPRGAVMTYYISTATHLVDTIQAFFIFYDQELRIERTYSDYREQDGVLYPFAFTYEARTGAILTARVLTLELNIEFPEGHFDVSACHQDEQR